MTEMLKIGPAHNMGWKHYQDYLERCERWEDRPEEGRILSERDFQSFLKWGSLYTMDDTFMAGVVISVRSGGEGAMGALIFMLHVAFAGGLLAADEQREAGSKGHEAKQATSYGGA